MSNTHKYRNSLATGIVVVLLAVAGCVNADRNASESARAGWRGVATDPPEAEDIATGRRIAQSECASCHSIDTSSVSPNPAAPPFREFAFLNEPDWVAYRLIEGMRLGHDDMPLFDFDIRSTDALMAYLRSLND